MKQLLAKGHLRTMVETVSLPTARLRLVAADASLLRAELCEPDIFARLLGAQVPDDWPPASTADARPHFLVQLQMDPSLLGWLCWYFCERQEGTDILIGSGGFKGRPGSRGTIEVGYAVLPQFQRQGYATEGVRALVSWAFSHSEVKRVIAEARPSNTASLRVLQKAGFRRSGIASEWGFIRFELSRVTRNDVG